MAEHPPRRGVRNCDGSRVFIPTRAVPPGAVRAHSPGARTQLHRKIALALERERGAAAPIPAVELATHFERAREPVAALRYYVEAAEAALSHFSPEECQSITERASPLLEQVPKSSERTTLQIALRTLHGLAATRVLGAGDEARAALQQAYALLDEAPQHPMRGRLVHGFGFMLTLRGEYGEALAVADRAEALVSASNDPVSDRRHARFTDRSISSKVGRPLPDMARARTRPRGAFGCWPRRIPGNPQVVLLGMLAVPLLHLGLVEDARAATQRAYTRARDRRWPMATLTAIWYCALLEVRLGNPERVAALADEMQTLVDEFALAHGQAAHRWFRGWADARMGSPREGYRRIREAYDDNAHLGMLAGASEILGYAAEALLLAGDLDAGEKQLEEALQIADKLDERVYLPQLLLLKAAFRSARGDTVAADAATRRAVADASAREAPWLELITLTDLCANDSARA